MFLKTTASHYKPAHGVRVENRFTRLRFGLVKKSDGTALILYKPEAQASE